MDNSLDAKVWIKRAKSNLLRAKMPKNEDMFYEDFCFDCQQSAEKALKGLIVHLGLTPHKTHFFGKLFEELSKRLELPSWSEDVFELNDYAVSTRCPDDFKEISIDEYKRAVDLAERVYNWVVEIMK